MEAKDTVMNPVQIENVWLKAIEDEPSTTPPDILEQNEMMAVAEAQAEISFKAAIGQVEHFLDENYPSIVISAQWQAKLKEWGI
jgi:hypothetical protein